MWIQHRHMARLFYRPFPQILWQMPPQERAVYLTFDDGPFPPVTGPLLDFLHEAEVPATFFLSGVSLFRSRGELAQLDYASHALGNHAFHHQPVWIRSEKNVLREISATDRLIYRYLGRDPRLFRPPYGIFSRRTLALLPALNKRMVLWSVMAYDFKWDVDKILRHLRATLRPGDIVVFHDSPQAKEVLLPAVREIVDFCREQGWRFGKLLE